MASNKNIRAKRASSNPEDSLYVLAEKMRSAFQKHPNQRRSDAAVRILSRLTRAILAPNASNDQFLDEADELASVMSVDQTREETLQMLRANAGKDISARKVALRYAAELERELIRERVRAGVAAARRRGARVGRPPALVDVERVRALRAEGKSWREVARTVGYGESTIRRAEQQALENVANEPLENPVFLAPAAAE